MRNIVQNILTIVLEISEDRFGIPLNRFFKDVDLSIHKYADVLYRIGLLSNAATP